MPQEFQNASITGSQDLAAYRSVRSVPNWDAASVVNGF